MTRLAKRVAAALAIAVLAVPLSAAAATADNGGSLHAGPRCCS
jgi:Spy/CpxP family protein refolding chaperone